MVSNTTLPTNGDVQRYQTEAPPALPAWFGSPASFVARTSVPFVVPCEPLMTVAELKLSFVGTVTATFPHQTAQRPEKFVSEPTCGVAYSCTVQKSASFAGSTHVAL